VVLKDDKLIEGTVAVSGEKVIVRQGALDRPFPKADVQFIGNTKDEAYRFMLGKVPANDPAARLRVARWCMLNGMRSHALTEAREVVKLDPKNPTAGQMVRTLEESLQKFPEDGATPAAPAPAAPVTNPNGPALPPVPPPTANQAPPMIPPAIPQTITPAAAVEPEPDVRPEAAAAFATRIQPILVNLCADCHAKPDHASGFRLARGTDFDGRPETAGPNLRAVAGQLNRADPGKSPLLVKSLTAHGGMKEPPLPTRQATAYRILEAWTYAAVGSTPPAPAAELIAQPGAPATNPLPPVENPATPPTAPPARPLPPPDMGPKPMLPAPTEKETTIYRTHVGAEDPAVRVPPAPSPAPVSPTGGTFGQDAKPLPPNSPNPANAGEPVDEFDPSVFNRAAHPGRR
jgi:hypothetical protein